MPFAASSPICSEPLVVTAARAEALTELVNIGFGSAIAPLAELLGTRIRLNAPSLQVVDTGVLAGLLETTWGAGHRVHACRQGFMSEFRGEALVLLSTHEAHLARLFGMGEGELTDAERHAIILEVGNIITGACVGRLGSLLGTSNFYTPPRVVLFNQPVAMLSQEIRDDGGKALVIHTLFAIEGTQVQGRFVLLVPPETWHWLLQAVDAFIDEMT